MGDARSATGEAVHVGIGEEIRMGQHGPPREQAEPVQRRGIGHAEARQRMSMRPVAFRAMRLHVAAIFLGQLPEARQRRIGAGRGEARRHHRQHQALPVLGMAADMLDHRARAGHGRLGIGVAIILRAGRRVVHGDLAHQRPLPQLEAEIGEEFARLHVLGGKVERRRRAVGEQVFHQHAVARLGQPEVGILGLERKGIGVEPDLQRRIERQAELGILRRMHMQVDEPRQGIGPLGQAQQRLAELRFRGSAPRRVGPQHSRDGPALVDDDQRIEQRLQPLAGRGVEEIADDGGAAQGGTTS